jgi:hypothetical protein
MRRTRVLMDKISGKHLMEQKFMKVEGEESRVHK